MTRPERIGNLLTRNLTTRPVLQSLERAEHSLPNKTADLKVNLDDSVGLGRGHADVNEPQPNQSGRREFPGPLGTAQLGAAAARTAAAQHDDGDAADGTRAEERHGEAERARIHLELSTLYVHASAHLIIDIYLKTDVKQEVLCYVQSVSQAQVHEKPELGQVNIEMSASDTHFAFVVDGGHKPWKPKTQEDVDGVGAGDVADGVVGVLLADGGGFAGEGVWQRRAERDERDGGDAVLEADEAAEDTGEVADDGGQDGDHEEGEDEAEPAAGHARGRHQREEDLEAEGEEVHHVVAGRRVLDVAAVHVHRVLQLLRPRLVVHAHAVHVHVGHHQHPIHHRVELFNRKDMTALTDVSVGIRGPLLPYRRHW